MQLVLHVPMCLNCGSVFEDEWQFYCLEKPHKDRHKCHDHIIDLVEIRLEGLENFLTPLGHPSLPAIIKGEIRSITHEEAEGEWKPSMRIFPGSLTPQPDEARLVMHPIVK